MEEFDKKIVALIVFCIGGGSKLLQSQIDGSSEVMSIPAYPLKYFYPHWREWKKKYKKIDLKLSLKLILKHHPSIIDSRSINSNDGLTKLGKNKNRYIKISKINFSKNYYLFLKNKKINSKNVLLAIHYAYFKTRVKNFKKIKFFIYHIHEAEYFNNYLVQDFPLSKLIVCCRDPINYFWKKIELDHNIEKEKFNKSDQILLNQNDYVNSLDSIFCGFANIRSDFFKKYLFIKFENLKRSNYKQLKLVGNYLKIKISKKKLNPTFNGLEWWSDKKYGKVLTKTFDGEIYDYSKSKENFYLYELFLLKYVLNPFSKKLKYKNLIIKENLPCLIFIFFFILLPTKFGIKNFLFILNPINLLKYIRISFNEIFINNNLKNYYFHAMYKHKKQYKNRFFLRFNFFRKKIFFSKKNTFSNNIFLFKICLLLLKFFFYLVSPLNLLWLYFKRISILIKNLILLRKVIN